MTRKTKESLEGIATAIVLAILVAYVLGLSGCATKHYGRQENLTPHEAVTLSCREIEIEIARTQGFIERVKKESQFSTASVLSFMGDLGVGNVMEKRAAIRSAEDRLEKLQTLRVQKCKA